MKHVLVLTLAALLGSTAASAQQIGDPATMVRSLLGEPHFWRTTSDGETWLYLTGTRLQLSEGFLDTIDRGPVIARSGATPSAATPAAETSPPAAAAAQAEPKTAWAAATHEWNAFFGSIFAPRREVKSLWTKEERILNLVCGLLLLGGAAVVLLCHIAIVEQAFEDSYLWGLGSLFVPPIAVVFVLRKWRNVWKPFLTQVGVLLSLALSGLLLQG